MERAPVRPTKGGNGRTCASGPNLTPSRTTTYPSRPELELLRCPSYRPIGHYPDCCPSGQNSATAHVARLVDRAEQHPRVQAAMMGHQDARRCSLARVHGRLARIPIAAPSENSILQNGACRRPRTEPGRSMSGATPSSREDSRVLQVRHCPPGYRALDRPNKYGAYCEIIPTNTRPPCRQRRLPRDSCRQRIRRRHPGRRHHLGRRRRRYPAAQAVKSTGLRMVHAYVLQVPRTEADNASMQSAKRAGAISGSIRAIL